jgi:hypothetical protein
MLVVVELQDQLLARERELDSQEGTIVTWEDGLVASECALGRACREHDAEHAQAEAARQDYLARSHAITSSSKHSINFNRMLEECQILLSLQEMDLEVWELKLVEEQACGLHSLVERDLSAELEELRMCAVEDELTAEARDVSVLVAEASNALVDLRMLPIWDIPQLPKMAQEVLKAAGVILKRLQEEHASGTGP